MFFWIITVTLTIVAAGLLVVPLMRRSDEPVSDNNEIGIYRDQLAEVERDLERGVLDASEAERTRTEISRRLLSADKATSAASGDGPAGIGRVAAVMSFLLICVVTLGTYLEVGAPGVPDLALKDRIAAGDEIRANRMSQAEAEELALALPRPETDAPADYLEMVQQLRDIVPTRPDDAEGWRLLARHEAALGNYGAGADAQARLIALEGESVADLELLSDLMVAATAGLVSPEAETVVRRMLDRDEDNLAARYYLGLLYAQSDRPDVAFRLWREVLEEGPSESIHVQLARGQVEDAAWRAGVEYTLPRAPAPQFDLPGPTAEQVQDASEMDAEDQSAMIQGMVSRLSDRLATEGGTASEWARLINALGVLGQTQRAAAIWNEAQTIFGDDAVAMQGLMAAAQAAGVAN